MKILLVDDEAEIRKVLRLLLEGKGYTVSEAENGERAVAGIRTEPDTDLVIMDIMMPEMNGIDAIREIRTFSNVPVLFLTAKSLGKDKSAAYGSGGDDYLVKPFSPGELILKVEALTRRYNSYKPKETEQGDLLFLPGNVSVNVRTREVFKNAAQVDVRDKEFDVLVFLAKNRGQAWTPAQIYEAVWEEMPLASSNNTVTVHVLNLRRKLEDPVGMKLIRTVWGKGYQID